MRFKNNEILVKWKSACRQAGIYGILDGWKNGTLQPLVFNEWQLFFSSAARFWRVKTTYPSLGKAKRLILLFYPAVR